MNLLKPAFAALTLALPVAAQDAPQWTGEGAFNAGYTTGNTETSDLGLGLKLSRDSGVWKTSLEAAADYGKTDGVETRNRYMLAGQLDRQFNDRLYGFGRLSYEEDQFSGFDSRTFIGAGLGYAVIAGERTQWTLEGGPGYRIDKVAAARDANGVVVTPASTEESLAVRAASNFAHKFNDAVSFTNDTAVTWADVSTQISNTAAITAQLTEKISGRVSFDMRHDTDPPLGFEQTDTALKIGVVYAFGG